MPRPGFLAARTLPLGVLALSLACEPPPDFVAAAGTDSGGGADAGWPTPDAGAVCHTVIAVDHLTGKRASCSFHAGAKVTETLPITEGQRATIPIHHVVVLMKENRSFDHLLGNLSTSGQPDAEAIPASFANLDHVGARVAPFHLDTTCVNMDPGHQWNEMHRQVNGGAMDGFVVSGADTTGGDGHFVMGNYLPGDIPFYYWLANTYAINDRHFPSVRSGTFPNRNFLLLGTADGVYYTYQGYPDPLTPTIFSKMDEAGVTWGVYTDADPFDGTLAWMPGHPGLHTMAELEAALADGTLPAVAFVDGIGWVEDEHPTADVQIGEAWTRRIYQQAVTSPLWPAMAVIWTYDEAGGFADHVPPPNAACVARPDSPKDLPFVELGTRVPLTVISPYARPHFVSHVVQDHTAITRFIEAVFGLPALTSRDANSDALLDMFDFGCAPALLAPPEAPPAGTGGCFGNIVLTTDHESYISSDGMSVTVSFTGVRMPATHDRIGVYRYGDVPTEVNRLEPVAWGYIGGQGRTAATAPTGGTVVIDKTVLSSGATWPLGAGIWIAYYLPGSNAADGHTPFASIDLEVTP